MPLIFVGLWLSVAPISPISSQPPANSTAVCTGEHRMGHQRVRIAEAPELEIWYPTDAPEKEHEVRDGYVTREAEKAPVLDCGRLPR